MDNLIFYTSLTLLAYYFLVHLPSQKKPITSPLSTKSTQTDPETEKLTPTQQDLGKALDQLIKGINDLNNEIDKC